MLNNDPSSAYKTPVHIRWMIRRDMPEVLAIEQLTSRWEAETEEDFLRYLRQRNVIGMVAEKGEEVLGFMIYELHKSHLHILTLAVHPDWHRQDIGRQMVEKLKSKLSSHRRSYLRIIVSDGELGAHLFLRDMSFKAKKTLRNWYDVTDNDAYVFEYEIPQVETGQEVMENVTENADF